MQKQDAFIAQFKKFMAVLSPTLQELNLSRQTFNLWMRDPAFAERVSEVEEYREDFVNTRVLENVKDGDNQAAALHFKLAKNPKLRRRRTPIIGAPPITIDELANSFRKSHTLSPDLIEVLAAKIADGCTRKIACEAVGIIPNTYYTWMNEGKKIAEMVYTTIEESGGTEHALIDTLERLTERELLLLQAFIAFRKADGEAKELRISSIQDQAEKGNWQAHAWWLERMEPEVFNLRHHHVVNGDTKGGPVRIAHEGLSNVSNEALAGAVAAAKAVNPELFGE